MNVKIKMPSSTIEIETDDSNILTTLAKNSIFINAYCGGRGICNKCIIRYINNPPNPTEKENSIFTQEEIKNGYRLACLHKLKNNDEIEVFKSKPSFSKINSNVCADDNSNFMAVDIGTTTISLALISNKQIIDSVNLLNPQVAFGGDVVSRISYSNEHSQQILSKILNNAVENTINKLLQLHKTDKLSEIVVSANPTMIAFFLNKNPKSIGEYPYTPPFTGSLHTKWKGIKTYIPPIVGAFVGSDITSGILNINLDEDFLFVDIGTNCEFILKHQDKIFAASIPGGPALEGSGIDYGTIAKSGAVEKVAFDGMLKVYTINNEKPNGITGSGLISSIALLRKHGLIDSSGRLLEAWEIEDAPLQLINKIKKEGFELTQNIYLTQNSIREFQLVKASLHAGIKILAKKTDVDISKIKTIYLSGGFTKSISKEDINISDFLRLKGKFVFLGNSSISGAGILFCKKNKEKIESTAKKIEYVEISNEKEFQNYYIEGMNFD